jgi:signal peptidase I
MTIKKTIIILITSFLFTAIAILFFSIGVSKLNFRFGYIGFVVAASFVIFSLHHSIKILSTDQSYDTDIRKRKTKKTLEILDWLSFLGVSCMGILLIFMFFIIPSNVEHSSMFPTLEPKDRVIVYHFMYQPKRNDIVVAYMINYGEDEYFVKRVFGMPNDKIHFIKDNNDDYDIYINDVRLESVTGAIYKVNLEGVEIISRKINDEGFIMDDFYLILGDNATGSTDSRNLGLIHERDIIGKVIFKI